MATKQSRFGRQPGQEVSSDLPVDTSIFYLYTIMDTQDWKLVEQIKPFEKQHGTKRQEEDVAKPASCFS